MLPSSHTSPAATSSVSLPQPSADWQSAAQPSPLSVLPSSQTSSTSLMSLPQVSSDLQSDEQPSPLSLSPSSQTSPAASSSTSLPQVSSDEQVALQPSPSMMLPSSQISPESRLALPQSSRMHTGCAAAHCVPSGQTMPLGHSIVVVSTQVAVTAAHRQTPRTIRTE